MRDAVIFFASLTFAGTSTLAAQPISNTSIICIEHIGSSDKMIIPIVISTSDSGIEEGRERILKSIKVNIVSSYVISVPAMNKMLVVVQNIVAENPRVYGNFGTFAVTEIQPGATSVKVLRKAKTLKLIKSLKVYCSGSPLFDRLSELQLSLSS